MSTPSGMADIFRRFWPVLAGLLLVVIALLIWRLSGDDDDVATATPTATMGPVESTPVPSGTAIPRSTAVAIPTSVVSPIGERSCMAGCLVRVPDSPVTAAILETSEARPSHRAEDWLWIVVSRITVDTLLVGDVDVLLVNDSPETLYLYATRLPDGETSDRAVRDFGEILDSVDGHAIVLVPKVPAIVTDLVNAKIWVEKVAPAPPSLRLVETAGQGDDIADIDLGVLLPQVDAGEIEQTILDMQATSSTDGTGVGTRQYGMTGNAMASEYLFTRLEQYGLSVWYEDFLSPEGHLSTNVIGEIPGRDSSMVYGVMAHLDSTSTDFSNAPGADDNGTGLAASLEIARILSGYTLEHPVHIIFVNAEETAIVGSMAYARKVVADEIPIEGVFNVDSVGSPRMGPRIILNADENSVWMMNLLVSVNDGYGLGQEILVRQNPAIIADDTMLRNEGIEAVMIAREVYGESEIHHTTRDTIENMSIPLTVVVTQLVLLSVAALVQ